MFKRLDKNKNLPSGVKRDVKEKEGREKEGERSRGEEGEGELSCVRRV